MSPLIEARRDPDVVHPAPAARRRAATATTCRSSRRRSSASTSTTPTWSSRRATARPRRSCRPAARVHLCYCHSPMRYAWDQFDAYFGRERARAASARARAARCWPGWRAGIAPRRTGCIASSPTRDYVAGRIARYYNRQASVLHPPVDTEFFTPGGAPPEPYFPRGVCARALQAHRRRDRRRRTPRRPLKIVGTGPDLHASARARRADRRVPRRASTTTRFASCTGAPRRSSCPAKRTSASPRSRPWPAAGR